MSFLHARRRMFSSAWSCVVFFWIMIIPDLIWMITETSLFWVGTERFYARSSSSGWNMEWWYGYWRVSSDGGVFLTRGNGKYWEGYCGVETYYIPSLKCLFQVVLKNLWWIIFTASFCRFPITPASIYLFIKQYLWIPWHLIYLP